MAEGRGRAEWARTSTVLALITNLHRDPKKPPCKPSDLSPFDRPRDDVVRVELREIKDLLMSVFTG